MARTKLKDNAESSQMSLASLAKIVKEKRESMGMSFRQLAKKADVSHNWIYRLELGEQLGSPDSLVRLARAIGMRPGDLFDIYADEPPRESTPKMPTPDNELIKVVISAVLEYLRNKDNLAELQELIEAMGLDKDKRYTDLKDIVGDLSGTIGETQAPDEEKGFRSKPAIPEPPKTSELAPKDELPDADKEAD
jgi:transcriptional regulator with XRE-family HTH domain